MTADSSSPSAERSARPLVKSAALMRRAQLTTPGGVNTARRKIDPPLCLDRSAGGRVTDLDGNRYIDFHAAYGAIFLGHCHPHVNERVCKAIEKGVLFGIGTTEIEVELAEKFVQHVPGAEQVVFCGSGSEATYHAIRLARAATGRTKIVKFQGHYHGFHDYVLRNVISTAEKVGRRDPASAGMLPSAIDATLVCRYNDIDSVAAVLETEGRDSAAVIIEPVAHNCGSILPLDGFLSDLRCLCDQHDVLLIFDEIITGFRHGLGGYQSICGVTPDLSTFGKALGNGYPIAAVAGPRELLKKYNTTRDGTVAFAGTYNGGAIAVAAALATIEVLESEPVFDHVYALGDRMRSGLRQLAADHGVPAVVSGYGSLYTMLFMDEPLFSYDDVLRNDHSLFVRYRNELVARGVLEMPENIGRNHIMYSHSPGDIDRALAISHQALGAALAARPFETRTA